MNWLAKPPFISWLPTMLSASGSASHGPVGVVILTRYQRVFAIDPSGIVNEIAWDAGSSFSTEEAAR